MSKIDIVRALKDAEYRESLSAEERALVPANSAGLVELDDSDLESVAGGAKTKETFSCTQTGGSATCTCNCTASISDSDGVA